MGWWEGKGEGQREGLKKRWKRRLEGAGQAFFLLRQRCIIYRRWWRQAASDGAEQRRQAAPFSFMGLFPVGRLCAGWMAAFEETRAAIELRMKARPVCTETQQNYSTTMSVTAVARVEKKRTEREWQRLGEIVGVFDFCREGRKIECFVVRKEIGRKRWRRE